VSIQFGRNRPNAVLLGRADWIEPADGVADWSDLHRHLVDEHLAVIVDTARRACRVGNRMLWSNVASSCASSFGAFMEPLADRREWIREMTQTFLSTARPELAAGGEIVPIGPAWAWQRHACCLYYQAAAGSMCGDCSLFTDEERRERYARLLAEVTP
jgi:ferric iron reductase protein FhuF